MSQTPHDALFKFTFSQVEHAAGELRSVLPPAIAERIDFTTLAPYPGSFIDAKLDDSHTDLVFSALFDGRPALLYLLLEHQSTVDPLMPFRILRYTVNLWSDWLKNHPKAKSLPPIVPLVIHHSSTGWTAAVALEDLIDVTAEARAALGPHLPRLTFLLDDLDAETDEHLRNRAMSAFSRVVLLSLRDGRNPEAFAKNVEPWGSVLLEVARSPNGLAALGVLLRYHHQVSRRPPSEVPKLFAAAGAEVMDAMKAGAEFFFADALREGRELGLQQGLQEGQLKATRTLVARLLTVRFGDLPPAVTSRIDAATLEELDRWGVGLLTANSLAELFGTT